MKKSLSLLSLLFAVALCTNLQASDGDSKKAADLSQTEEFECSNGKNERELWAKNPKLVQQRTKWIAGFDLDQQKKAESDKTPGEKQSVVLAQRLPSDIQLYIFDCAHGDTQYRLRQAQKKFVGQNMQKLIPALMHWPSLYSHIDLTHDFCQYGDLNVPRCQFYARFAQRSNGLELEQPDQLRSSISTDKNSFGAGRFASKDANRRPVFFKVPGCQLKRLLEEKLDLKDLRFIAVLSDQRATQNNLKKQTIANTPDITFDDEMAIWGKAQSLDLTPSQLSHLAQLATKNPTMAENLTKNYLQKD